MFIEEQEKREARGSAWRASPEGAAEHCKKVLRIGPDVCPIRHALDESQVAAFVQSPSSRLRPAVYCGRKPGGAKPGGGAPGLRVERR